MCPGFGVCLALGHSKRARLDYLFKRVCVTRGRILFEYLVCKIKSERLYLHICVSVQCQRQSDSSRVRMAKGVLRDCARAGEKWKDSLSKRRRKKERKFIEEEATNGKKVYLRFTPGVLVENQINPRYVRKIQ